MATPDSISRKSLDRLLAAAAHTLEGQVDGLPVPPLLAASRRRAARLLAGAPDFRRRMNRKLFAMGIPTLALYRTLREDAGLDQERALTLVDDALTHLYQGLIASPIKRTVAGQLFRLPVVRNGIMRAAEGLDEPGGFAMHRVTDADAVLAFDVQRCPLSDFFARQGAPEVGPLICKLDDVIVDVLPGVTLERTGTIAAGASRCDFRYRRSR